MVRCRQGAGGQLLDNAAAGGCGNVERATVRFFNSCYRPLGIGLRDPTIAITRMKQPVLFVNCCPPSHAGSGRVALLAASAVASGLTP